MKMMTLQFRGTVPVIHVQQKILRMSIQTVATINEIFVKMTNMTFEEM